MRRASVRVLWCVKCCYIFKNDGPHQARCNSHATKQCRCKTSVAWKYSELFSDSACRFVSVHQCLTAMHACRVIFSLRAMAQLSPNSKLYSKYWYPSVLKFQLWTEVFGWIFWLNIPGFCKQQNGQKRLYLCQKHLRWCENIVYRNVMKAPLSNR